MLTASAKIAAESVAESRSELIPTM